jgi:hypothetical protein
MKQIKYIWNFADDEPVTIYGKMSWDCSTDKVEELLRDYIVETRDCTTSKKFMLDWFGVVDGDDFDGDKTFNDMFLDYMGN